MPAIWHIYYVENNRYASHGKLVVIACISVKPMGFLINSEIHRFIQNRQYLLISQVVIKAADYKCLNHDSYVNCVDLFPFENSDLSEIRDPINDETRMAIKKAASLSKNIEGCYKKII